MKNLIIVHCTYTGQRKCRVLKTPENTAIYFVEYFPITETVDKRFRCTRWVSGICQEQKISELMLKMRGFSERGNSTKVLLNFHLQQQIYTKIHTKPVCSMSLSIILHDQKVSEITESHHHKNSVMYCKVS